MLSPRLPLVPVARPQAPIDRDHAGLRRHPALRRVPFGSVLLFALALTGCPKKPEAPPPAPPPPAGLPVKGAAAARADLLGTIVLPSLDRSIGSALALAKKADPSYPAQDPKQLRDMILSGAKVPAEVAASVRTDRPLALVMMSGGASKPPLAVAAVEMASADAASKAMAAAGAPAEKKNDAIMVVPAGGGDKLWLWRKDAVLVAAESVEGLIAGATLAIEARAAAAGPDDLITTAYPDAIARSQGTDVKTALAKVTGAAREQMKAAREMAAMGKPGSPSGAAGAPSGGAVAPGGDDEMAFAMLDVILARIAETASGDVTARIDPVKGVSLGLRLHPRPGTAFAKSVKTPAPYALDPALLQGGEAAFWSTGPGELTLQMADMMKRHFAASADPKARALVSSCDKLLGSLSGASAGIVRFDKGKLAYEIVYPLKAGAAATAPDAAALIDAVAAIAGSPALTDMLKGTYGPLTPTLAVKREGSILRATISFPKAKTPKGMSPDIAAMMKKLVGSEKLEILMTVANGRMVAVVGAGGKARLQAVADGKPGAPATGELGAALAETKGHDGIGYFDFGAFVAPLVSAFGGGSGPGSPVPPGMAEAIGKSSLPIYASWHGGDALAGDLRVPLATITAAGALAAGAAAGMPGGMK